MVVAAAQKLDCLDLLACLPEGFNTVVGERGAGISLGQRQLVCFTRAMLANPRILILDEPTRGIDIGAKYEIYKLINQLVQQGIAVIVISSELPEVLGLSDRVLVMHEGKLKANLVNHHLTQEQVMEAALRSEHHVEKHVV